MKRSYKKLLSLFAAIVFASPFVGCEADAEETNDVIAVTNAPASLTPTSTGTNATVRVETNTAASDAQTDEGVDANALTNAVTNAITQQTTIIQRIAPTIPADVKLSKGVQEVVRLLQSGVSETVVLLFIEKSTDSFELDAADIVYLNDIGVPATVLAAMLNHDGADPDILHDALNTNSVQVATAPAAPMVDSNAVTQAAPQVEVSSNYVAAPQYGGTPVTQDPNAQPQQQVVVEQQPAVVVTQPAITYSYFYNSLSPYGSWVYVADYGWCWQPTIAVTHRSWRPYVHGGRWLYSDAGWYWHSDYSWGWAPFHYGRWHCSPRAGWVWMPDYTWGPSWVTWRRTGDYCGWAPLPPRCYVRPGIGFSYWGRDVGFNFSFGYSHDYYTFVPTRRFCDRRVIDHVVPTDRTRHIYRDSTVVNNYINGNNNTIINNGVGRDYVARHAREIPRVRVQEATGGARVPPDRLVRNGAETVVYRPQRPAPTLVAAHEAAVARTRNETARAVSPSTSRNSGVAMRPNAFASRAGSSRLEGSDPIRPSGSARVRPSNPAAAPGSNPRGGALPATRNETARSQLARSNTGVTAPVFGTPAPIRPEPDRSAEILRSRATHEARVRPSATTGAGAARVGSPIATPTVRPIAPSRSVVPRFTQPDSGNRTSNASSTGFPQRSTRPGAPLVSTQPTPHRPEQRVRTEVGRGSAITPRAPTSAALPVQRGNETLRPRAERLRPTTSLPSAQPAPASTPAASPAFSRPNVTTATPLPSRDTLPPRGAAAPQVVRPSQPAAQSPAFSRTAPNVSTPTPTRQPYVPQRSVAPAQPIQRQVPVVQTPAPAARPQVIQRSENFSRPSMPVQSARQSMAPPQRTMPGAPIQRPSMAAPQSSRPSMAAPPMRSAPRVNVSPAPVHRGGYRSGAPAAASRPSPPNRGEGRGRVEIGR